MLNKRIKINLNDFESIKSYAQEVIKFTSDVNIIKGSIVYDGKSIIAILALKSADDIYVEIISDDEVEINRFKEVMEKYK